MVYRRRRTNYRRRRPMRRRSYTRKRRYTRRTRRGSKAHSFVRSCEVYNAQIRDNVAYSSQTFKLSDLPSYAEFTTLYDRYRINCVVIKLTYSHQPQAMPPTSTYCTPLLHWCIDNDDATVPATVLELAQYKTYRSTQLMAGKTVTIKIYPKPQTMIYQGPASTGYSPKKMWISTTDYNVPHFALKYATQGNQAGGAGAVILGSLSYQVKYYFQCKDVK